MPFACIYVPNFPVAAVLRAEPELGIRPLAILEGKPPLETILAVNDPACRLGIAPGMTKPQAELCSELILRPHSPLQNSTAHAALLDCAQSFSPCVEDLACDTSILDLAGMESLLGSLPEIARALRNRAAALGLGSNIAVAANADTAVLAARGFSGVTVIPRDREAECLGSLPLKVLFAYRWQGEEKKENARGLEAQFLDTFDRWGIRNLRALAGLPEVALSERLGQEGLRLQQLARGATSRTLVPVDAPLVFEEAVELEYPIVLLEPLAFLLNRLLDQICARLASRALAAQELHLTLELDQPDKPMWGQPPSVVRQREAPLFSGRKNQFRRALRLPLPMLDPKLFLKLLQLDLNAHPPGAPILKIHLSAEPARPRPGQAGLFLPPSPEPEKLELTLARIAGMVGENKVGALELLDTYGSEGFRLRRFMANVSQKTPREKNGRLPETLPETKTTEEQPAITALRRFRPALRVTVTLEQGHPTHVTCAKKKEVQGGVLWKAGPWRSSGDWWEKQAWSRDEWDIALQGAAGIALFRLVHDLLNGVWFLEGTYD